MNRPDHTLKENIEYISLAVENLLSENKDELSLRDMDMTPDEIGRAMEALGWETECNNPSYRTMTLYFVHPDKESSLVLHWDVITWEGYFSVLW